MCFACRLIALYICVKSHENTMYGTCIRTIKQTRVHGRNGCFQCSKGNNSKSRKTRVKVHMFFMSSDNALHTCEVS